MNVRLPKSFNNLPPSERELITEHYNEKLYEARNEDLVKQQKKWLKYACILLADFFNFTEEDLLLFLANWRSTYMTNSKFETEEEQSEYLSRELSRIFVNESYPEMFIEKLEKIR